jgi:hypothetical protein
MDENYIASQVRQPRFHTRSHARLIRRCASQIAQRTAHSTTLAVRLPMLALSVQQLPAQHVGLPAKTSPTYSASSTIAPEPLHLYTQLLLAHSLARRNGRYLAGRALPTD